MTTTPACPDRSVPALKASEIPGADAGDTHVHVMPVIFLVISDTLDGLSCL